MLIRMSTKKVYVDILALSTLDFPYLKFRPKQNCSKDFFSKLTLTPLWFLSNLRIFIVVDLRVWSSKLPLSLISMGLIDDPLQMINTSFAVQIGLFYSYLPFMVLPIYAAVERYNFTLSEAAADLYATKWVTLRRVILPSVRPGIIAGCILVFVPSLGAFLAPDLLGGAKNFMIGSLIEEQFKGSAGNWPFGAAASMILLSMVMIILTIYARQQSQAAKGGG